MGIPRWASLGNHLYGLGWPAWGLVTHSSGCSCMAERTAPRFRFIQALAMSHGKAVSNSFQSLATPLLFKNAGQHPPGGTTLQFLIWRGEANTRAPNDLALSYPLETKASQVSPDAQNGMLPQLSLERRNLLGLVWPRLKRNSIPY